MPKSDGSCKSCVDGNCAVKIPPEEKRPKKKPKGDQNLEKRLRHIQNVILVMSGKGGVGKSSTAVNLALALAMQEQAVGLLDIDIHGPSVPKMLGIHREALRSTEDGVLPANALGIKVMSIGLMLEHPDDAIIWRGAMKHAVIQQFIGEVAWGYLDFLVVDCPPGTGDELISIAQTLGEETRAVIVTTPQEVAVLDVRKSIGFCRQLEIPILGIVENMSGFACPGCGQVHHIFKEGGGVGLAAETGIPFLGAIPLDPTLTNAGDEGRPCLISHPDGASAQAFASMATKILAAVR